jgi:hypothetical protein
MLPYRCLAIQWVLPCEMCAISSGSRSSSRMI